MTKEQSIVDYYRARAAEYENIYYRKVPKRRQEIEERCQYVEKLAAGKTVLELACGTGYWTQVASNTADEVVATDIVLEMIKQAKAKQYKKKVNFVAGDLYHPPLLDSAFDLIMLGFWLSHEPRQNYDNFFETISRPLKPCGQIWMIDNNLPAEGPRSDSVGLDEFGNNFKRRRLENGEEYTILKNYFSKKDLERILSKRFTIKELIHQEYYWSVLLQLKQSTNQRQK